MNILEDVFFRDGSLRDIYVCGTTADDWKKLLTFLQAGKYRVTYALDDTETDVPTDFASIEKHMGNLGQLLSIYVGDVRLNCHFFWIEEIELDLLPNEVDTEEEAKAVFEFMAEIGRVLNKEVILTHESAQEHTLVLYEPTTDKIKYKAS